MMNIPLRVILLPALLTLGSIPAHAQGSLPCGRVELPLVAERTFAKFFTSNDALSVLARRERGIVRQSSSAPHGVLRNRTLCERLRTAALKHLGYGGGGVVAVVSAQDPRDNPVETTASANHHPPQGLTRNVDIVMFEFGNYLGAWVHVPTQGNIVVRDGTSVLHLFRRSDLKYISDWQI